MQKSGPMCTQIVMMLMRQAVTHVALLTGLSCNRRHLSYVTHVAGRLAL